jgi:hypothetical protein
MQVLGRAIKGLEYRNPDFGALPAGAGPCILQAGRYSGRHVVVRIAVGRRELGPFGRVRLWVAFACVLLELGLGVDGLGLIGSVPSPLPTSWKREPRFETWSIHHHSDHNVHDL